MEVQRLVVMPQHSSLGAVQFEEHSVVEEIDHAGLDRVFSTDDGKFA